MFSSPPMKAALPVVVVSLLWLSIWGWSALVVQPRTVSGYQEKCRQALMDAEIADADGKMLDLTKWLSVDEPEKLSARRRSLNDASLYLRRLIDTTPEVSQLQLQLALAMEASALLNTKLSDQAMGNGEIGQAETFRKKAFSDSMMAQDTMQRLAREDNTEAVVAKSWDLARKLRSPIRDEQAVEYLVKNATDILQRDPANRIGMVRLGQLRTHQAFSIDGLLSLDERGQHVQEAVGLLSKVNSPSMIEQALLAEAEDAFSPEQAIQTSIAASQRYWGELSTEKQSAEGLASLFSCLLRLGSFQEAQSLVGTKLPTLSLSEQFALRGLCSDYCLRYIVCANYFPSDARQMKKAEALSIATRVDAQSPSLLRLFERLVVSEPTDTLSQQLFKELGDENNPSLQHLVLAVRSVLENQWSLSREELRQAIGTDVGLSSAVVPVIGRFVENGSITQESAMKFLDLAMEINPDATGLWFAAAVFFEKHDQLAKAAECLEGILVKTNNDPQILSFLASIYSRLDRPDDLKRVRSELQKQRKRPS